MKDFIGSGWQKEHSIKVSVSIEKLYKLIQEAMQMNYKNVVFFIAPRRQVGQYQETHSVYSWKPDQPQPQQPYNPQSYQPQQPYNPQSYQPQQPQTNQLQGTGFNLQPYQPQQAPQNPSNTPPQNPPHRQQPDVPF